MRNDDGHCLRVSHFLVVWYVTGEKKIEKHMNANKIEYKLDKAHEGIFEASMRPRHKAAEYAARDCAGECGPLRASMRPRHKAAEYGGLGRRGGRAKLASMRPRHKAAEYA